MADDELEAIRRQRMAELQAKHGVRTESEQGSVCAPALKGDAELSMLRANVAKPTAFIQLANLTVTQWINRAHS